MNCAISYHMCEAHIASKSTEMYFHMRCITSYDMEMKMTLIQKDIFLLYFKICFILGFALFSIFRFFYVSNGVLDQKNLISMNSLNCIKRLEFEKSEKVKIDCRIRKECFQYQVKSRQSENFVSF